MLKTIAIILIVLLCALLGLASTKPDQFQIQREISIKAPPEKVFAMINDFHNWADWSPWEKLDPQMKKTFSGLPSGQGSVYEWEGSSKVGKGRMEIIALAPGSKISIKLDFLKPIEGHNMTDFTLSPEGDSTKVTWAMRGPSPFISKVMQVFMSMDSMVGGDFEKGLANLKAGAEKK